VKDLDGKSIATSYPIILGDYLKKHNLTCEIHEISGSVEIAPGIGLADAICDIVSSGSTLFSNGLKEVEQVFKSEAVLIGNPLMSAEKKVILDRLLFRFGAVRQANENKYVLLNAPNNKVDKIISILPGMKSPTVLPLAVTGWSSIHSVINEDKFWDIIEQLKAEGAEGILVIPIEKMVV
jgi:ATP phosphoribosyltransferase